MTNKNVLAPWKTQGRKAFPLKQEKSAISTSHTMQVTHFQAQSQALIYPIYVTMVYELLGV